MPRGLTQEQIGARTAGAAVVKLLLTVTAANGEQRRWCTGQTPYRYGGSTFTPRPIRPGDLVIGERGTEWRVEIGDVDRTVTPWCYVAGLSGGTVEAVVLLRPETRSWQTAGTITARIDHVVLRPGGGCTWRAARARCGTATRCAGTPGTPAITRTSPASTAGTRTGSGGCGSRRRPGL